MDGLKAGKKHSLILERDKLVICYYRRLHSIAVEAEEGA